MATAQPFDPELHHIGIGDDASNLWGLFCTPGSYRRSGQQNAFGKISDIGPDSLIGTDRLSVWTQRNYSGGEFQRDWADDAMFDECGHFSPNQLGLGVRAVPPLIPIDNGQGNGNVGLKSFDLLDGKVYTTNVTETTGAMRVLQYANISNKLAPLKRYSAFINPFTNGSTFFSPNCAAWNYATRVLWVGFTGASGTGGVRTYKIQDHVVSGNKTGIDLIQQNHLEGPADPTYAVTGVQNVLIFSPFKLVTTVHAGSSDYVRLWNYVGNADANTKWASIGMLPGDVVASTVYNNAGYYLCRTQDGITSLSMTNGTDVFPVLKFPYYFKGTCMIEYAGRLMVGGMGYDLDGNNHFGELYEVTGTSLRLVRTFKSEANRTSDARGAMSNITCLAVAEGMLVMPDDSCAGLEFYDATTDSFYGGSRLMRDPFSHANDDPTIPAFDPNNVKKSDLLFTDMLAVGSSLLVWGKSAKDSASGMYRILEPRDVDTAFQPYLITSDFSPEPGRTKSWSQVVTVTRYVAPLCQASIDSGETWITCPQVEHDQQATRHETTFDLSAVPSARAIRLKFIFNQTGAGSEQMAEVIAHSLSFGVHASGKSGVTCTIALAEHIEPFDVREDLIHQESKIRSISDYLWNAYEQGRTLTFVDADRTTRSVYLSNIEETRPVLDPQGERYLALTMLEL